MSGRRSARQKSGVSSPWSCARSIAPEREARARPRPRVGLTNTPTVRTIGRQRAAMARGVGDGDVALRLRPEVEADRVGAGVDAASASSSERDAADLDERPHAQRAPRAQRPGSGARHERLADEDRVDAGAAHRRTSVARLDAALGRPGSAPGASARARADSDRSIASVSRLRWLTPMSSRAGGERALRPRASSWTSTSASRPACRAASTSAAQRRRVEDAHDQQHRVGAGGRASSEIALVEQEVLAQQRHADGDARRAQIGRRAVEERALGEHRDRGRAGALVARARWRPDRRRAGSRPPTASAA